MARYIKLEDAIEVCGKYKDLHKKENSRLGMSIVNEIYLDIDNLPTADVEEVKHGEWIQEWELEKGLEDNDEIPYIKCSLCGHMEWGIDKEMDITPNYCNECGAKMDGKDINVLTKDGGKEE